MSIHKTNLPATVIPGSLKRTFASIE